MSTFFSWPLRWCQNSTMSWRHHCHFADLIFFLQPYIIILLNRFSHDWLYIFLASFTHHHFRTPQSSAAVYITSSPEFSTNSADHIINKVENKMTKGPSFVWSKSVMNVIKVNTYSTFGENTQLTWLLILTFDRITADRKTVNKLCYLSKDHRYIYYRLMTQ